MNPPLEGAVSNPPFVVTVIPTFHEKDFIKQCLTSLCNQTYPSSHHQIFVVDGNSSDGTSEIVTEFIESQNEVVTGKLIYENIQKV